MPPCQWLGHSLRGRRLLTWTTRIGASAVQRPFLVIAARYKLQPRRPHSTTLFSLYCMKLRVEAPGAGGTFHCPSSQAQIPGPGVNHLQESPSLAPVSWGGGLGTAMT